MATSSTTTTGNLPTNLLRSRDSGINVQEPTNLSNPTDLLIGQLLKQNKEQLIILRSILEKQGRPGNKIKSTDSDSLSERNILGDLKEFTGGMKDQLLDIAGYVTGVNFFRKKQQENNNKPTTENTVDNTTKDTTQTQVQTPPLKAAPAPTSQIIERITEEKSTPILGNLQALFTNMLEEVTVIRKFVEGTLSINTFKGGSKYIERDYQNQKVRHINEDAARMGKAVNLTPIPTEQSKGIELSDNDSTKEDSYIEKLSTAIANKLASLLEDVGIGSKGIPGVDVNVGGGGANKKGPGGKTPPKAPSGKTPKAPSKFGTALSIGMGLLGIGASAAIYSGDLGNGELPPDVKAEQERIANMSESERKAYYDKINENSKIKPRDETSEERLKRLGVTPNESAGGGRGSILPPMIPPMDNAIKSSDGSILKDATEENMFAKMNQSMMGSLQPITSNNVIDNSSNQLMAVAPSVRNDYSSWLRYQHANMVG